MSRHSTSVVHAGLTRIYIVVVLNINVVIDVIHVLLLALLHLSLIGIFSAIVILRPVHVPLFRSIWRVGILLSVWSNVEAILLLVGDIW